MPSPNAALATERPDLVSFNEMSMEAMRRGFIGLQVAPIVEVGASAGTFGVIPLEALQENEGDLSRAPGSGYSRGEWQFEPSTYTTKNYGREEPVDDREAKMYKSYFNAEQVAAARAYAAVLRAQEKRIAAMTFDATTFSSQITSAAAVWSNQSGATPLVDIQTATFAVADRIGDGTNLALVLNWKMFRELVNTDDLQARVNAAGAGDKLNLSTNEITAAMVAEAVGVEKVLVAGSYKNTAKKGQDASMSQIWSDSYAAVLRLPMTDDFSEPAFARTFHWSENGSEPGGGIFSYREESTESEIIRVKHDVDNKAVYGSAIQLIDSI